MSNKLTNALLVIVIVLTASNLFVSLSQKGGSPVSQMTAAEEKKIPRAVVSSTMKDIVQNVVRHWNENEIDAVWDVLHPLAQVQMDHDGSLADLRKLRAIVGEIHQPVYSHQVFLGTNNGRDFYSVIYKTMSDKNDFSGLKNGEIRLTFFFTDGELGLFKFSIHV